MADKEKYQGETARNSMYGAYQDALNKAGEAANKMDLREQAAAQLKGIDYELGNADRIAGWQSGYMDEIWGADNQAKMDELFTKWGTPADYTGGISAPPSDITDPMAPSDEASIMPVDKPSGTILTDEEEALGNASILGI
jgi:hypothetical protein